mmetsp:Transcript_32197/g.36609  ORF Transcript_32197/g.36609 Transcript_32197/m.36609 type:complete len:112 (-) Transcript_32197:397-732(-)
MLKRSVYVPVRKAGGGHEIATILTFLVSGLLHEYSFSIHNAAYYEPGKVTLFLIMMGVLILLEGLRSFCPKWMQTKLLESIPTPIVSTILVFVAAGPFESVFMKSWIKSRF